MKRKSSSTRPRDGGSRPRTRPRPHPLSPFGSPVRPPPQSPTFCLWGLGLGYREDWIARVSQGRWPGGTWGKELGGKWFCFPPPRHSDLDSASVDSDMYDLPKKEDALLYQSKGKAPVGWALTSSFHSLRDLSIREDLRPQSPLSLSSPGGGKLSQAPNRNRIKDIGPGGGHHCPLCYCCSLFPRL